MFEKSAQFYDLIYSWIDYEVAADIVHRHIQDRRPGARTLLDVACGTGNHLVHLTEWYESEGVDLDPKMLDLARTKVPEVVLHEGDMIDFSLRGRFDAVICMFSSIIYMRTPERMDTAIANMARHLEAGGVLILEPFVSPEKWIEGRPHADFVDKPDIKIARMTNIVRDGAFVDLEFHHLVSTSKGVEYFTETHLGALFTDEQYRGSFEKAGLAVDYDPVGPIGRGLYIGTARS